MTSYTILYPLYPNSKALRETTKWPKSSFLIKIGLRIDGKTMYKYFKPEKDFTNELAQKEIKLIHPIF